MRYVRNDYSTKERAWLWLSRVLGARVAVVNELIRLGGQPEALYDTAAKAGLGFAGFLSEKDRALLEKSANEASVDRYIAYLAGLGVYAVTPDSEDYPDLLREIYDPPNVLYCAGRLRRQTELPIAVVGSRKSSDYGLEMAEYFGRELASCGACVVSGLAIGCDAAAARGALQSANDYPSVAVLGSGINVVYPDKNRRLYDEIAERGCVISELLPGSRPTRFSFPQRNRIISGLSRGVLVVEAGLKSGTSITVDFALEFGRDVFAVPGRITDPMSRGTNGMIKRGEAKAVFDIEDILIEYGVTLEQIASSPVKSADLSGLGFEQKKIMGELLTGEKNLDSLCEATGFSVSELNIYLTEMELSGLIKQLPNKVYGIR